MLRREKQTNLGKGLLFLILLMLTLTVNALPVDNYVNWKAHFWVSIPDDWTKIDYLVVDRFLAMTDTSQEIYDYEAVFAPESSEVFIDDAYLIITFDSVGKMTNSESDSLLDEIAQSYATDVYDAMVVEIMTELTPGRPIVDRRKKVVSVLTEMAYRAEARKKLWLYMRLNDLGLISMYFYSPDSTYDRNKPIFDSIISSLSFENLRDAAGSEQAVFSDVGGESIDPPKTEYSDEIAAERKAAEKSSAGGVSPYLILGLVVVAGIVVMVVLKASRKKKQGGNASQ